MDDKSRESVENDHFINRVVQKNLRKSNAVKKNTSFKRRRTSGSKESFKGGLNGKHEVQLGRGDLEKI